MKNAKYWLQFVTDVKKQGWRDINGLNCCQWFYSGENFIVEVSVTEHDPKDRNDLANLWKKHGFTKRFLPTTLHVSTYYTDVNGHCNGLYNIQHKHSGSRTVVDFDYLLEATPENVDILVAECIRMRELDIHK